ncbi:MAG: ABC transporter permease, partial [Lachnospiraceae bacterium]|nr:ABC transporter permease [Lachnospiraceae bacterium]
MWRDFLSLLKKDFKLMLSGKFLLLALVSLLLYSCYINFIYVGLDQDIYPVYLYDPFHTQEMVSSEIMIVDSTEELQSNIEDGYAVGINAFSGTPEIVMVSSNIRSVDHYRAAYAFSLLSSANPVAAERIGADNKEMKSRREITCEFLFFELAAVGFLGLASTLFKEKQMGIIRV